MDQITWMAKYTVGNLGQSSTRCIDVKMESESISLSCYTGLIAEITSVGAYKKDSEADLSNLCTSQISGVSTGLVCQSLSRKNHPFQTQKLKACLG